MKAIKLLAIFAVLCLAAGCSTAYKSEPEKTVYFIEITEAGKDVKNITARSGYYDAAVGSGIVSLGGQLGFSPSTVLVAAVFGGLLNNTSNALQPDEVFLSVTTSNEGTFRGVKQGRVKFNPEMLLWVKGDALREYTLEGGQLSMRLADQDLAKKRRDLLNASITKKQASN